MRELHTQSSTGVAEAVPGILGADILLEEVAGDGRTHPVLGEVAHTHPEVDCMLLEVHTHRHIHPVAVVGHRILRTAGQAGELRTALVVPRTDRELDRQGADLRSFRLWCRRTNRLNQGAF